MLVWVRTSYLYAKRDPVPLERLGRGQDHFAWVDMKPSNVALGFLYTGRKLQYVWEVENKLMEKPDVNNIRH